MCVSRDGTIHIASHNPGSSSIDYMQSRDGGDSFSQLEAAASGIVDIQRKFPPASNSDFPQFPGGKFRVMTLVCIAPVGESGCVIAWSDCRSGMARIFHRVRDDNGVWQGPSSGAPLLSDALLRSATGFHHFHPQLAITDSGIIGCAFYEFGEKRPDGLPRIDVLVASTSVFGAPFSFSLVTTVTEQAWDPAVDAPLSRGNPAVTFIGEYFGFDAAGDDFCVLWTDTRTGKQELWFARVHTVRPKTRRPRAIEDAVVAVVTAGVKVDAGGIAWIKGVPHIVPPRGPSQEILGLLAAYTSLEDLSGSATKAAKNEILRAIAKAAQRSLTRKR